MYMYYVCILQINIQKKEILFRRERKVEKLSVLSKQKSQPYNRSSIRKIHVNEGWGGGNLRS